MPFSCPFSLKGMLAYFPAWFPIGTPLRGMIELNFAQVKSLILSDPPFKRVLRIYSAGPRKETDRIYIILIIKKTKRFHNFSIKLKNQTY